MRAIAISTIVLTCLTAGAQAQVSVDMRALEGPGGQRPAAPRTAAPAPRVEAQPPPERRATKPVAQPPLVQPPRAQSPGSVPPSGQASAAPAPAAATPPRAQPPRVSNTAPAPVPIPMLPVAQPPAPPPIATAAPAPPPAQPLPPPIQVSFATGKTELSAAGEARIRALARAIPATAVSSVNVIAYAAGKPDDPSTARRLSLSRGLAVRAVLLDCGIPSSQIYVRAMGSQVSADRADLTVARLGELAR